MLSAETITVVMVLLRVWENQPSLGAAMKYILQQFINNILACFQGNLCLYYTKTTFKDGFKVILTLLPL